MATKKNKAPKATPTTLPPLPTFSDWEDIIPLRESQKRFKIQWRQWIPMKSHKHIKEQCDAYVCESNVRFRCKTVYKERKTLQSHRRNTDHKKAHKAKDVGWKKVTDFSKRYRYFSD